jgi:Flp pilus assembly protein TadD
MRSWTVALTALLLAACATAPLPPPSIDGLLHDELFGTPSTRISADDIFALSDDMRRFLRVDIADELINKGARQGLFDSLYAKGQLKLEYDTQVTRNAAQTFAARAGNCLSMVIMTAAFAKELGLPVRYQNAVASETWSRDGDIHYFIGHVNLTLGIRAADNVMFGRAASDQMTIDFLPPQETRGMSTRVIQETTIVAMYMNNRAAESFSRGKLDDAYGWARAAILHEPRFLSSFNTLGVIYQRHGNLAEAEKVFVYALARDPENTKIMSNLVSVLTASGRAAEAASLAAKLATLEPNPPYSYLTLGMTALRQGDFKAAREHFAKEVVRAPYNDEFHYWLAVASLGLGDTEQARRELVKALEYSTTRKDHDLYAAKLDRLRAAQSGKSSGQGQPVKNNRFL